MKKTGEAETRTRRASQVTTFQISNFEEHMADRLHNAPLLPISALGTWNCPIKCREFVLQFFEFGKVVVDDVRVVGIAF